MTLGSPPSKGGRTHISQKGGLLANELNPMKTLDSASSRCGARTRLGLPCKRARALGRPRCRLHGGAPGSGAPFGDRNGRYQTGEYTNQAKAERRWITEVVRAAEGDQMDHSTALVPANLAPSELKPAPKPRPKRVRAKIVQRKGSVQRTYVPIDAPKAWAVALQAALGTSSGHFIDASMRRLMAATMLPGESVPTTNSLSAALALVESMEPENEAQAALAVNAACLHGASTNLLSRINSGSPERSALRLATAAARLERAFHSALETYYKLKRGNTQLIRVEKLEIQSGAQAIVGNVSR